MQVVAGAAPSGALQYVPVPPMRPPESQQGAPVLPQFIGVTQVVDVGALQETPLCRQYRPPLQLLPAQQG